MGAGDTTFRRASSARPRLLSWWEIMPWQRCVVGKGEPRPRQPPTDRLPPRDNEFVLSGYRPASYCWAEALKSIFYLHNETVNIWTHLLASAWFLAHGGAALFVRGEAGGGGGGYAGGDGLAVALYCGTTAACFLLSALFHTVADASPGLRAAGHALDHLGIAAGLWGTGASTAHFALYCAPPAVRAAHGLLLAALAALAAAGARRYGVVGPSDPRRRLARLLLYAALGAALFAPLAHAAWRAAADADGHHRYYYHHITKTTTTPGNVDTTAALVMRRLDDQAGLRSFLVLAAVQLAGGAVYAARAPERWAPRGLLDRFGQSHQLMHALVVIGAAVRLEGLLAAAQYWRARDGSCSRPF